MRLKKSHILVIAITILLLNVSSAIATPRFFTAKNTEETVKRNANPLPVSNAQDEASDLLDFDLVTEEAGWVLLGQNVYWSADGGQRWENITPGGMQPGGIRGVTFLDTLHGWMVAAHPNQDGEFEYSLARTFDRGLSWQVHRLNLFTPGNPDALAGAIYLQFLDENTGYLVVRRATSTPFRVGTLFKTADGGLSWTRLAIPIGEAVYFTSESTGWVAGGASGEELYQTLDGGRSWNRRQVNTPLKPGEKRMYRLPVFESEDNGLLPVAISDGETARVEYFATTNRGNSWRLLESIPVGKGISNGNDVPLSLINSREWMMVQPNSRRSIKSIQRAPQDRNRRNIQGIENLTAP
ncbi:MAG TPA: hypothetical protein VLH85_00535, partial [Levilinea sp.]|nr:hypothetical protein [Levilinea sp.]